MWFSKDFLRCLSSCVHVWFQTPISSEFISSGIESPCFVCYLYVTMWNLKCESSALTQIPFKAILTGQMYVIDEADNLGEEWEQIYYAAVQFQIILDFFVCFLICNLKILFFHQWPHLYRFWPSRILTASLFYPFISPLYLLLSLDSLSKPKLFLIFFFFFGKAMYMV